MSEWTPPEFRDWLRQRGRFAILNDRGRVIPVPNAKSVEDLEDACAFANIIKKCWYEDGGYEAWSNHLTNEDRLRDFRQCLLESRNQGAPPILDVLGRELALEMGLPSALVGQILADLAFQSVFRSMDPRVSMGVKSESRTSREFESLRNLCANRHSRRPPSSRSQSASNA